MVSSLVMPRRAATSFGRTGWGDRFTRATKATKLDRSTNSALSNATNGAPSTWPMMRSLA
jgi:hypothetical protein